MPGPTYPDPFGDWHEDPCADLPEGVSVTDEHGTENGGGMKPDIHPDYHPVVFQDADDR